MENESDQLPPPMVDWDWEPNWEDAPGLSNEPPMPSDAAELTIDAHKVAEEIVSIMKKESCDEGAAAAEPAPKVSSMDTDEILSNCASVSKKESNNSPKRLERRFRKLYAQKRRSASKVAEEIVRTVGIKKRSCNDGAEAEPASSMGIDELPERQFGKLKDQKRRSGTSVADGDDTTACYTSLDSRGDIIEAMDAACSQCDICGFVKLLTYDNIMDVMDYVINGKACRHWEYDWADNFDFDCGNPDFYFCGDANNDVDALSLSQKDATSGKHTEASKTYVQNVSSICGSPMISSDPIYNGRSKLM